MYSEYIRSVFQKIPTVDLVWQDKTPGNIEKKMARTDRFMPNDLQFNEKCEIRQYDVLKIISFVCEKGSIQSQR